MSKAKIQKHYNMEGPNICIGRYAGSNLTSGKYCIMIGDHVQADDPERDYQLNIENVIKGNLKTGNFTVSKDLLEGNLTYQKMFIKKEPEK